VPNIVLYQPEIPPNTGNIIRLCANSGFCLHLIEPLGFELDDKRLRRAGLDYHELQSFQVHHNWREFVAEQQPQRIFAVSTRGHRHYSDVKYRPDDTLVFGPETKGLPTDFLDALPVGHILRIPMLEHSRSLNLSNAAAILAYEAWRQLDFVGSA